MKLVQFQAHGKHIYCWSGNSKTKSKWKRFDISGVCRKFLWGIFIQWHMVVISIWCALFVTSQCDVIVLFPNQRFGEVCWHNMHIFLHPLPLLKAMCHCTEYKLSALQVRLSEENICNATTQQFITAKISDCAFKQGSKHTDQCVRAIYNCKMRLR